MKIGIVGNYGNDNQGDESILEGILTQLENHFRISRSQIVIFTNNEPQTKERYGTETAPLFIRRKTDPMKFIATILHHRKVMPKLDLLIMGGGGILMDLYPNNPFVYGMYGLLIRMTKVPAVIFGAGVGPINSWHGKKIIKMIGNSMQEIAIRDAHSKKLLEDIGVKKDIHVILDPAFYLRVDKREKKQQQPLQIGVTALPYFHESYWPRKDHAKYTKYIEGMAYNLDKILSKNEEAMVNFFSTKHPLDTNTTKDIQALMTHKERTHVVDRLLTHREIIEYIQTQDLVIGTRLHSLILAIAAKTPVIAVGYHNKVRDVMKAIDLEKQTIMIEHVARDKANIFEIYEYVAENWQAIGEKFATMASDYTAESLNGMEMIERVLNRKEKEG